MIAVMKKELRSYLYSVTGCIFIAANLLFLGIYFTAYNLSGGYPTISYTLNSAVFIFLLITPILTMRIMAEEQRQKTDQLLLTSPTSIMKIVLGKYFAMLIVFLIPVGVTCIYPLILKIFGEVAFAESYTAVLGYFVFGAACIAIGLFLSSLTENQIVAAVLTFAVMLLGFLMTGIESLISSSGNVLTKILSAFDLGSRLTNIMSGMLDLKAVIYYLSVTVLMIFLTYESVQKRRFSVSSNTLKLSAYNSTVVVFAVAIAVIVNLLAGQIPETYTQIDMTKNNLYTVSDESKAYLKTLDKDVTIYCMSKKEDMDKTIVKTLSEYTSLCKKIKVQYVNPNLNPTFASKYTTDEVASGSLIVVCGDKSKVIGNSSLYETQMDYQTYSQTTTGYDGEGQITAALSYVTSDSSTKLCMITGHGEYDMSSLTKLSADLSKANIDVKSLNLMDADTVSDCDIMMIMAPTSDYTADDAKKVSDYLKNGGKAIIATAYPQEGSASLKNFYSILQYYGCSIVDGVVLDTDMGRYYSNNPLYLLPNVESGTLTSTLTADNKYVFAPYAQGITVSTNGLRDTLEVTPQLTTSDQAYSKTNVTNTSTIEKEAGDIAGPFDIGVYATEGDTKLALFSSAEMFSDSAYQIVGDSNNELIMNAVNDMVDTPAGPSIPAKEYDATTITVSRAFTILYSLIFTILLPIAIVALGVVLWARRRHK